MASLLFTDLADAEAVRNNYAPLPSPTPDSAPAKKSNHRANVVRIGELRPHTNADNLELLDIDGYQVVVRKGEFKPGDLAVYIQPDSIVPQSPAFKFIWQDHIGLDGTVPEKRRRITVRKFRGEWSEGLLLLITDFTFELTTRFHEATFHIGEGDDLSELLGITHYDPEAGTESTRGNQTNSPRRKYPKTLKGWFFFLLHKFTGRGRKQLSQEVSFDLPKYDVEALKNYLRVLKEGDHVIVTEKIHGSNARFVYVDGVMYAGSRTQWKSPDAGTVWNKAIRQNPWIEEWCRTHPGVALYGEVTPTQKGFNYGCGDGQVRFFLFDIYDNGWVPQSGWDGYALPDQAERVPQLYDGPYLAERIYNLVDGNSFVSGAKHIREGVVVKTADEHRVPGLGRAQLKIVSNKFLEKDSK